MQKAASHRHMGVQECMNDLLQEPCVGHSLEFCSVNLNADTQEIHAASQHDLTQNGPQRCLIAVYAIIHVGDGVVEESLRFA